MRRGSGDVQCGLELGTGGAARSVGWVAQDLAVPEHPAAEFHVGERAGIEGYDHGLSATWLDFDNDDWLDLYVANDFKGSDKLYKNNRDGTFTDVIGETTNHDAL